MGFDDDEWKFEGEIISVEDNLNDDGILDITFPSSAKLDCWKHMEKIEYPYVLNGVINRLNNGFAPIVVICGPERVGKSTMAVDLAYRLCNEAKAMSIELNYDTIQEHLAYTPERFLEIITESEEDGGRKPILIDEAGVVAGSQDHNTRENRVIKKIIQTMGYLNNVYIFILPDFMALDKKIRNKVDFKIELYERGKAKVTGIRTNFGKMRSKEFNFYKQPLPSYWMSDFNGSKGVFDDQDKQKTMTGYDEKEKAFKMDNAKDMLSELKGENDDGDDVIDLSDIDFSDMDENE